MKKTAVLLFLFLAVLLSSCSSYIFLLEIEPADAVVTINGKIYSESRPYASQEEQIQIEISKPGYLTRRLTVKADQVNSVTRVALSLEPIRHAVTISSLYNVYPSTKGSAKDFHIKIDDAFVSAVSYYNNYTVHPNWLGEGLTYSGNLQEGSHQVVFSAAGYPDFSFPLEVTAPVNIMVRHPAVFETGPWEIIPLGVYDCGRSPKQTDISPDGQYIYIALLDDAGFQVFDVNSKQFVSFQKPEGFSKYKGFVEGLFIPEYSAYFVSQMTSGSIFEYDVSDSSTPVFRRRIPVKGDWTKVMAYCPSLNLIAASNWVSNDVSLVDYATGDVVRKITGFSEPRGLLFSKDGKHLYVTTYAGGGIYKFSTSTWSREGLIAVPNSSMRHIRASRDDRYIYVSSMAMNKIYKVDTASFTIEKTVDTFIYPNTIDITDDGRFLFVSNRGPNNPESYLIKGLEPGMVVIIDLATFSVVGRITAGTQPTGLDVSPDGSFFVLSNFQDHTIELYALRLKTARGLFRH